MRYTYHVEENIGGHPDGKYITPIAERMARAAIAKAEGRAEG